VEDNGMVIALVCKVWDVLDNAFIKELQNSFSLIGEFYAIAKVFRMIKPGYKRRYIFLVFTIVSKRLPLKFLSDYDWNNDFEIEPLEPNAEQYPCKELPAM